MKRSYDFLFQQAIDLTKKAGGETIVEIGSIRNEEWGNTDGHSTAAWAKSGLTVWTVDFNLKATELTRDLLSGYGNVRCITEEGIRFLEQFSETIDLLYLDGPPPRAYKNVEWAERAFLGALPNMSAHAVLLIDDTDLPDNGKGGLAIPAAQKRGFTIVNKGRQTLMVRGDGQG